MEFKRGMRVVYHGVVPHLNGLAGTVKGISHARGGWINVQFDHGEFPCANVHLTPLQEPKEDSSGY